jgi:hypothetical protein
MGAIIRAGIISVLCMGVHPFTTLHKTTCCIGPGRRGTSENFYSTSFVNRGKARAEAALDPGPVNARRYSGLALLPWGLPETAPALARRDSRGVRLRFGAGGMSWVPW